MPLVFLKKIITIKISVTFLHENTMPTDDQKLYDQKIHDLAVSFAAAEYKDEIARQLADPDTSAVYESAQQRSFVFISLYRNAVKDFKEYHRLFDD